MVCEYGVGRGSEAVGGERTGGDTRLLRPLEYTHLLRNRKTLTD